MTESNETNEPNDAYEVEFHEQVQRSAGQSTAVRVGIVLGSALLFVVGAVAVMGASTTPSTGANPAASTAPAASGAPDTTKPGGDRPNWAGPKGAFGRGGFGPGGVGPGAFGRIGFGEISIGAINGSDISLKTDDGWTRTITITSTVTITKGGAKIAVGDLAVGDQVRFAEDKGADGTYTVTAVVVVLPSIAGQVTAIDGNTLTVTQPDGTTATIHVDGNTTYQVNGATGSLSDLKVGSFVVAEGTQRSDGSLDAAAVHGGPGGRSGFKGPGGPGGYGGPGDPDANASPAPSTGAS